MDKRLEVRFLKKSVWRLADSCGLIPMNSRAHHLAQVPSAVIFFLLLILNQSHVAQTLVDFPPCEKITQGINGGSRWFLASVLAPSENAEMRGRKAEMRGRECWLYSQVYRPWIQPFLKLKIQGLFSYRSLETHYFIFS